ncbi:MAG TPA: ester cyclase [Ktedonobacterales bacterium]|jgi:predicted ester cyclase|nr:ester cyclase [Ktedonobacterales bacterium]
MTFTDTSIAQQERNMEVFRRLIEEGFSRGHTAIVDEVLAPDCVEHQVGVTPANAEGVKGSIAFLHQLFPDLRVTIEDMAAAGDRVWARLCGRGTHRGPIMGMPPSGNTVTVNIMDLCRFEQGKIVEHWGVPDTFAMFAQMGISLRPPQSRA